MGLLINPIESSETLVNLFGSHESRSAKSFVSAAASDHFVQLYESDSTLVADVAEFVRAGLDANECCVIIATPSHREALEMSLRASGHGSAANYDGGRLVVLDAAATLFSFMDRGVPMRERFLESVGKVIAIAARNGRRVRAFGEMVALLWHEGNPTGAIQLEQLWNELAREYAFSLYCAYPISAFERDGHAEPLVQICSHHTRVIPGESYSALSSENDRMREISRLQLKARALEAEIVHRKALERNLACRERELAEFLQNAVEAIHKVRADGTILWANRAELELLGYPYDAYVGHSILEFHVDFEVGEAMLARLNLGETLNNYPARLRAKDDSIKHVLVHSNTYLDMNNELCTRCFTRDITERIAADMTRNRLAAIVDSADDAIIGKTTEGIITSWNRSAERMFGFTAEEAIGRSKKIVFPPDRMAEEEDILARICRGESIEHFETVRRRKDGTLIDVSLTISGIRDSEGRIVGASTIARDISAEREQRRQVDVLNARLKRSMMETHHRVKNSLQIMSALIDMQRNSDRESVPMSEITRLGASVRALAVIHSILTQDAKEGSEEDALSAKQVLDQLLASMQEAAGQRKLTFECEDVRLTGRQATSLALATNELVANALKHGKCSTDIRFRVGPNRATLVVRDDGSGFAADFDPISASHTGLELVESVVKWDLCGSTHYESLSGGGGEATISFPVVGP